MATLTDAKIAKMANECDPVYGRDMREALRELAAIRRDGYAPPGKLLVDEAAGHAIAGNVASNVCCADCTNRVCGVSELAAKRHDWPTSADCYEAHMRALGLVKEPEPVPEPEDENDLQDAH